MVGFLLIIAGVIFLLKNLGVISGSAWEILWPVLLIVAGLTLITRRDSQGFFFQELFGWKRKKSDEEE